MKRHGNLIERILDETELMGEVLPGQTIVELAGDRRVLIEYHSGVTEYGREKIRIRVKYGEVCIYGNCLEMIRMSAQQLIISGQIDSVSIFRG